MNASVRDVWKFVSTLWNDFSKISPRLFIFGDNIWAQEKCFKHLISTEECTADRWNHDKKSHYKACGGEICFRKDVSVMRNALAEHFSLLEKANYCWRKCIMDVWKGIEVCRLLGPYVWNHDNVLRDLITNCSLIGFFLHFYPAFRPAKWVGGSKTQENVIWNL